MIFCFLTFGKEEEEEEEENILGLAKIGKAKKIGKDLWNEALLKIGKSADFVQIFSYPTKWILHPQFEYFQILITKM